MPCDITYFSEISVCPWECTYASLGHTLMHAKRVFPPAPAAALVDVDGVPPPSKASAPLMPDEAAFDPPTTNDGAASFDTPHAGNGDQPPRSKSRRAEGFIIPDDTPSSSLLQGATSPTTQAHG